MACIALSHNAHSERVASCRADWKGVFKHTSMHQCKIFVRPVATLLFWSSVFYALAKFLTRSLRRRSAWTRRPDEGRVKHSQATFE